MLFKPIAVLFMQCYSSLIQGRTSIIHKQQQLLTKKNVSYISAHLTKNGTYVQISKTVCREQIIKLQLQKIYAHKER